MHYAHVISLTGNLAMTLYDINDIFRACATAVAVRLARLTAGLCLVSVGRNRAYS